MFVPDPGLLKTKKAGDPISAREWNSLVRLASRDVSGENVLTDDRGWTILDRPPEKQLRQGIITCQGPNGETAPTDPRYWAQFADTLAAAPGTPEPVVEVDGDDHDIVIATNHAEIPTGTHGLRVGTVVEMWQVQDLGGNLRWVFCFLPAVFAMLFGGMFNAFGMQRCDNFARLDVDAWSRQTITTDWNEAEQGFGVVRDVAWFEGTLWAAGTFTLSVSPSGTAGYGLAYYDEDTEDWVGVVLGAGEHGGVGYSLYVWDDGSGPGPRLFYGQLAGSGPPPVGLTELVAIQFNAETKVVTVDDIGWTANVGGSAIAYDMLAWDDGQGGGEKLYIVGWFGSGASFNNICTWDGSSFAGVAGGTLSPLTDIITSLCAHEFGPEDTSTSGSIAGWGDNAAGQLDVPAQNVEFVKVSAGADHSLGLKSDGSVVAWGSNSDGQADEPSSNSDFIEIAAGGTHNLALKADGSIVAWGNDTDGQSTVPAPNSSFIAVAAGADHSLGLKSNGSIIGWGKNTDGQTTVPAPNSDFVAIAAGSIHSLGLKSDGSVVCWGNNGDGQCNVPAPNSGFTAIAGGGFHSLGLKSDTSIVGWGRNTSSQTTVPSPNSAFTAVAAGNLHSLGLKSDRSVAAWGSNSDGQTDVPDPNREFLAIAAGESFCLVLQSDGLAEKLVVCGEWGQIGSMTDSENCAKYNPFADAWEKMGQTELTLPTNATCMSVASFNERVWVAKGAIWDTYGQGDTDNFAVLFNGPEEDWRSAYDIIKDVDNSGATNGFSTTWWDGENNVRVGASINWLTTYQGRLHVGGNMSWRSASQGQAKTGPLAWWEDDPAQPNARYGWWRRTLPLLRGEVHVLMNWQGGLLVGGNYVKGLPRPGAGFIRNLGVWRDPGGVEELGTWEGFGTGVVGTVYCAAIFNGQLYIGGDIIEVDGVAVKGVARFDGENWHYVANFSDYGTVRAMTVHGDRLIIGGDFIKADGQPSLKILCAWTGTGLETIIADIDALDGFPIIRALYSHGGYLYAGGWFDVINDGGAVTAHSVARMDSGENWEALEHDDGPPASEGLATGFQCYSISSHTPYGLGNDWIYCGTDGDARPDGSDFSGDEEGLWRWNPSSPEWAGAIVVTPPGGPFSSWAKTPVRAMIRSANNDLWVGLQAQVTVGEAGGEKHQVWWFQPNDNEVIRFGGPAGGIWESDILALAYTDVGAGPKVFGAGNIQVVGTIDTRIERPCQLLTSIGADDRVVEVAGGLGVANYMAQFTQDQFILRMRQIQFPDVACPSLVPVGAFGTMNDGYSEYVVGVDLRNRLAAVAGGLTRPLSGVPQGVADIQLLDNPLDWGLQPCEHNPGFWWIMCGGYDYALNRIIRDDDAGLIDESIHCYGIIAFDGMYYRRLTQGPPIGIMRTLCMFKGSLLSAGWSMAIVEYTGTPDSGSWDYLANPLTTGNIYDVNSAINRIRYYPEFSEDDLFILGYLFFYPTVTDAYAFSAWNGTTFTKEEPPGFAHTVSVSEIPQLYTCCLGDLGSGVRLFCGGKPSTANARPVVVRTSGGSWSALGPSSGDGTLRGVVNGLALVRHPSGPILYATGEAMEVEISAAWISCQVAKYDPATGEWEPIGSVPALGAFGVPAAVADHHGYDNVNGAMYRFITGGAIGEIANQSADLGTGSSVKVWGMAQYREPPIKWQAFQPGGGVNGFVVSAETAGEKLYGPPAPLPI